MRGYAHVYPRAHINTDEIIPARHLNTSDESELAAYALEDVDPGFAARVRAGDFLVVGEDFGCGSSREHAVWALRGAGIRAVTGAGFARIFFRNSINNGFLAIECPEAASSIEPGDELELDLDRGIILNLTAKTEMKFVALSEFARALLDAGGLLPYVLNQKRGPGE